MTVDTVPRAVHKSSVFLNGRPRSPLKILRRRRSLELPGRRMISGAPRLPVSRRARRPLSQSAQLMGRPLGIVGTGFSEFICHFANKFFQLGKDTVFGPFGKLSGFWIHKRSESPDIGRFQAAAAGLAAQSRSAWRENRSSWTAQQVRNNSLLDVQQPAR